MASIKTPKRQNARAALPPPTPQVMPTQQAQQQMTPNERRLVAMIQSVTRQRDAFSNACAQVDAELSMAREEIQALQQALARAKPAAPPTPVAANANGAAPPAKKVGRPRKVAPPAPVGSA